MNLRFVEAFYWSASLKSVTGAARKLYLTQSAVSSRIRALEEELGAVLLDRRDKQFRLTVAGVRFLGYAERILQMQKEIKAEMGSGAGAALTLRIGVIESVLHSWLIPMIETLRAENAALELELTVETSPVLVDQIRRGVLDLVFAAVPVEGMHTRALPVMEMVFVGNPQSHRRRMYRLGDLAGMDILTFQRGSQPHVALLDLFRQQQLAPKRVHTISSISAMTQLVEGGFGVATLPLAAAQRLATGGRLKLLRSDFPLQPLPVFASYRSDPSSRAADLLSDEVLRLVARHSGQEGAPRKRAKG